VDDTGNVTQNGEQNVDAEISTTSALQEDTDGRENDGKNDLEDVASGERHVGGWLCRLLVGSLSVVVDIVGIVAETDYL
jgi:hypothetical protein